MDRHQEQRSLQETAALRLRRRWGGEGLRALYDRGIRMVRASTAHFDGGAGPPNLGLRFRTVSLLTKEKCCRLDLMMTLCRRSFPASKIGELYRARWQIAILLKEMSIARRVWKRGHTNQKNLVRATVWLSVIATLLKRLFAHVSMSDGTAGCTLRCAEILKSELPARLRRALVQRGLKGTLKKLMGFLRKHGS